MMHAETKVAAPLDALLLEIARCPVRGNPQPHPCASIISLQDGASPSTFQLPEPWSGDLACAPILFLSSNPSISADECYPRPSWPDARISDFFWHRFGGGEETWTVDGVRPLGHDGSASRVDTVLGERAGARKRVASARRRPW